MMRSTAPIESRILISRDRKLARRLLQKTNSNRLNTMEEHEDQRLGSTGSEKRSTLRSETRSHTAKVIWRGLALFLLGAILWQTFHTVEWRPNFDVNNVLCFRRSWWGFKEQIVVCEWRKDADPDRDPAYGWCTKYSDGKWHTFYEEQG